MSVCTRQFVICDGLMSTKKCTGIRSSKSPGVLVMLLNDTVELNAVDHKYQIFTLLSRDHSSGSCAPLIKALPVCANASIYASLRARCSAMHKRPTLVRIRTRATVYSRP